MIRLRTLGTLDLRTSGGEELRAVLAQPRRAALIAYLALATPRGAQRRDTILALFWPELDSDRARNALGQAVHFLRRSIGADAIVNRNGDGLAIEWSNFWCDATAFEEALDTNRVGDAMALYRGDLLEGFHIADAPGFERWLDSERARLASRYIRAVETLAAEREAANDFQGAALHWRALVARDPYNSRLTLRLMRALKAAGDPAGALLQARQHERLLHDELGIAPDAEVRSLVRQLQVSHSGDITAQPTAPAREPPTVDAKDARYVTKTQRPRRPGARRTLVVVAALVAVSAGVGAAVGRIDDDGPGESDAMKLYSRGRQAELSRSLEGLTTAAGYYRSAIASDTSFALGHAGLSDVYTLMAHYDLGPKIPFLDSARILAQRAVSLDSTLAETRAALAMSLANDGHYDLAEKEFRRAIQLGPNNARPSLGYAMLLVSRGRGEEALVQAERAITLDPLAPRAAEGVKRQAHFLNTGERPELKVPVSERRPILKTETGEPWARAHQAVDLAEEGRCEEARADVSHAQRLVPDSNMIMLSFAGMVEVTCGNRAKALTQLDLMKRRANRNDKAIRIAMLHARLGDKDSAFSWLARHERWLISELTTLAGAPYVDQLRDDPRFLQLRQRLGMTKDGIAPGAEPLAIPTDVYVRDLHVRALNAETSRNETGLATARDAWERAIARDSTFAPAYAGLAGLYGVLGQYGYISLRAAMDSQRMMVGRAVTLDSTNSEVRTARAVSLANALEFEAAEREFRRAIELNPSDARAHFWYSTLLIAFGRGADAQRELQRASELGLSGWRAPQAMQRYAHWLVTGERPYRTLPPKDRRPSLKVEPGDPWALARQAEDLAEVGECTDARLDLERAQRLAPDNVRMRPFMARVEWWCGERARARALLDDMKRRPDARDFAFDVALMHTFFGETDSAFVWLGYNRWTLTELSQLSASPYVDPLRSDPRFPQLQRRLGVRR